MNNNYIQVEEEESTPPIHGDILDLVLSHVPLTELVLTSYVSNSWKLAVTRSLQHIKEPKPWLLLHTQTSKPPYTTTTRAYDPRSDHWIQFISPSIKYVNILRSSHSDVLYMLSPWSFSFSVDALHLTWHHTTAPLVWRNDPIVAVVGRRVVIAGGNCGFEDELIPVEIYDIETRVWSTCESMPSLFKDADASTWHSIAVDNHNLKLYITEKHSGITYGFDPESLNRSGPYNIRPDPDIFYSVIGFANNRMIMTCLLRDSQNVVGLKVYEVDILTFKCVEMAGMPSDMIAKLKGGVVEINCIGVRVAGNIVYVYNSNNVDEIGEVFVCEIVGGEGRWRCVQNVVVEERRKGGRVVFSCCGVSLDDLKKAMGVEKWRFRVVD